MFKLNKLLQKNKDLFKYITIIENHKCKYDTAKHIFFDLLSSKKSNKVNEVIKITKYTPIIFSYLYN